nr:MAG TPA: hypothetical protein [Caudoviricetes sp.]
MFVISPIKFLFLIILCFGDKCFLIALTKYLKPSKSNIF